MDVSRYEASAALTEPACGPCQDWRSIVVEFKLDEVRRSLELPCRHCQSSAWREWIRKHVPDAGDLVVIVAGSTVARVVAPREGSPIQPGDPGGEPKVLIKRLGDSSESWVGLDAIALVQRTS